MFTINTYNKIGQAGLDLYNKDKYKFEIYNEDGELVDTLITDEKSRQILNEIN
mgnify:CR=1 FL=1